MLRRSKIGLSASLLIVGEPNNTPSAAVILFITSSYLLYITSINSMLKSPVACIPSLIFSARAFVYP